MSTFVQFKKCTLLMLLLPASQTGLLPVSSHDNLCTYTVVCMPSTVEHWCAFPADLPAPQAGKPVPRVITFQRKRANRRVINEDQLMRMLSEFGKVSADENISLHPGQPCSAAVSHDLM